jgi:hypothetical protein
MKKLLLLAAAFVGAPLAAQTPVEIANQVSEQSLRRTLERLVSFGTRHTLSADEGTRGLPAAQRWTAEEFGRYSEACGGCLRVETVGETVEGLPRIPGPSRVESVIAIQRGTTDPDRVVIITAHIDSRVTDVMNAADDAPGANDDGSGTAAVLEAARILSRHRFPATIVYAPLAGEEQGLVGARILAEHARRQGWRIVANLNNDMIGNTEGQDGARDADHIRVFSEGIRADAMTPEYLALVRRLGGENDSPSRNLSRWLASFAETLPYGIAVRQVWRNDRFGRGGDHSEFLNAGFPAVRVTEAVENYHRQHQDLRTEDGIVYGDTLDGIDWDYLTRATRFNVAALAALARAPMPPAPRIEGAVTPDTTVSWDPVPGAAAYMIRWRPTDAANWQEALRVGGGTTRHELTGIRIDDYVFGVSSVSADGHESPVASAVPGGAFRPYEPPSAQQ